MVKYDEAAIGRTFQALSDPTRRAILAELMAKESVSVSELAEPFGVTLPAVIKHIAVLDEAGLVVRHKQGRTVLCRLSAAPLEDAAGWLNRYRRFWDAQLDRLAEFVEKTECPPTPGPASGSNGASTPRRKKSTPRGSTRRK